MTLTQEQLQALLPEGDSWGDSLTPERLAVILRKYDSLKTVSAIAVQAESLQTGAPALSDFKPLQVPAVYPTPDPKYVIVNNRLANAQSFHPLPLDEGGMYFRFKDIHFVPTVEFYLSRLRDSQHAMAVISRRDAAIRFAQAYPWRMKEPDTLATPQLLYAP